MATNYLLQNSKKRGRPKSGWTQARTAKDLNISQQAVSNAILIASAVELCPCLANYQGEAILKAVRFLRNPDSYNVSKLDSEAWACVKAIAIEIDKVKPEGGS